MKPKLLHSYLKKEEWYLEVWNKIVKDETDWWEQDIQKMAHNPTDKQLQEMKELLKDKEKRDFSDEEARDAHIRLFTIFSIATSMGVKKTYDEKRDKRIKEWKKRDRLKNKRVLSVIPFDNITCSKCKSLMEYRWSDLWEESGKNPVEKVMFFYRCPNECMNKLIFEDGMPWISKENNKCAICDSDRQSTVTKDNQGKIYIIYECVRCKSRQVESDF